MKAAHWIALALSLLVVTWLAQKKGLGTDVGEIKVGLLHSLSGTMAISETSVVDATRLAIEEINARGGVLGRRLKIVPADGASDWPTFAREARRLIVDEQVQVVFGCWTSASRKTVKPVFEEHDHLLFYPVQYEGLERSPNIVYTGAAPNQQIIPGADWAFANLGRRMMLVGSDYVFPRMANAIIRDQVALLGGEILAERYLLLGSDEVGEIVQEIKAARPDVVLNTINGDSNVAFFRALRAAGVTADEVPVMSFSVAEDELRHLRAEDRQAMVGDYAVWNYFQTIDTPENQAFVRRFKARFGEDRVVDDPMEAGYFGVHLWAQAVREAGSASPAAVRKALGGQRFVAPGGDVWIEPGNHHTWKTVRVGRVTADGQFAIVWSSGRPLRPEPFPPHRSVQAWSHQLEELFHGWGQRWANPGAEP